MNVNDMSILSPQREREPLWKELEKLSQIEKAMETIQQNQPKILTHPNPILRHKCILTSDAENTLIRLRMALLDPLENEYLGVGLSANQIGDTDRVCIIRYGDYHLDLINPRIIEHSEKRMGSVEECLSVPGEQALIMRWEQVVIKVDNYPQPIIARDFDVSRVIQHEMDHLDGKLILDYAKVGRNDLCPCGSGKKHKRCCGAN
jgi:peptide deformylase